MGVNCSCAAEELELKQKDLKENADTVKQDNDEAIREIRFANAQPILNDTGAEAVADEDDKRNSDKAVKKEEDDEPKSTTSKESTWNRRDFFLQSSGNVLTNALCAVIENPGDFEAFYTVKEKVGAGQFGTVSAAVITSNGAERAVKTVEKKAQRSFLTALRAEMEIMKVLDHPNLITICEIFENSENIILVMKLCKGPHLTQYVERVASLSEKQASLVMRDLLRAVAYMHNSQVCHRDLKGENCLMLNQGPPERNRLKICDFGLSCKFEPGGFLSGRMGSVSHIGPEVLKSPDKYTHACDCWSCGIIFYHLICGFLPFHEEKEVLNNRLSFSDRHFCDFSEDGCRLISALVERDVQKRMSAKDALSHKWFLEHLKDARSHGGDVQGSPMGTPQSNPSNGSASIPPSGYAERVVRFRGFNKWKQSALRVIANMLPENENNAAREFFLTLDTECRGQVPWATMCEACGFEDIDDAPKEDVRFTELLAATFERKKGLSEKMLKAAYQNYDKSGDQKVSLLDLREGRLIGPLTAKDFKRISRDIGVGLGDNFYYEGVKNVDDHRFSSTFEHVYKYPALKTATWYMIAGNHDYGSNVSAQIAYTKKSKRWHFPHFFYTQVLKIPGSSTTVQLVMIDTTLLCCKKRKDLEKLPDVEEQLKWIKQTLEQSTAEYLIVAGHHPVLSAGIHGNTPFLISKLKPLLEENDVTAYLSGHDHNLQHIKEDQSNVHYIVTGNGNFYNSYMLHKRMLGNSLKFFHGNSGAFTLFEATPEVLKVFQIDECGNEVYNTQLQPRTTIQSLNDAEDVLLDDFFTSQS